MIVLTADQTSSRRTGDRVPDALLALAAGSADRGLVLPFERTVGDELQGVLDDPVLAVDLTLDLLRTGGWYVGLGAGPVDTPLASSSRAASGAAFVHARTAVERAKSRGRGAPLAVEGADPEAAADAEAVLVLLAVLRDRRSDAGWAVVDSADRRQEDVARELGITQQAVSLRLRSALWAEETAARPAAARLLGRAQGTA